PARGSGRRDARRDASLPRVDAASQPRPSARQGPVALRQRGGGSRLRARPEAYDSGMSGRFVGVRWWLGIAFAVVAATSTAIVVSQFSDRSENAFRRHGASLTLKDARRAAHTSPAALARFAERHNVQIRIFHSTAGAKSQLV